jgi:hypothetical protein
MPKNVIYFLATSMGLFFLVGISTYETKGYDFRVDAEVEQYSNQVKMKLSDSEINAIAISLDKINSVYADLIFIGDSHARHLAAITRSAGYNTYFVKLSVIKSLDYFISPSKKNKIIFAFRWQGESLEDIRLFLDEALRTESSIYIIRDIPSYLIDPAHCLLTEKSTLFLPACSAKVYPEISEKWLDPVGSHMWNIIKEKTDGSRIRLIDPRENLCQNGGCRTEVNGQLIYRDKNHLNEMLTKQTAKILVNNYIIPLRVWNDEW